MAAKARECRARVVRVRRLAPAILEAELRMEDPPALEFDAGQWVSVPFGPKLVRAYTLASTPRDGTTITLCADVAPRGIGSRWFEGLRPDDVVSFKGPVGGFVFDRGDPRTPLFVAEEIGIVPIRSILCALDEAGVERPATLVQWARTGVDLVYRDELEALARRRRDFVYHPVVDGADAEWSGERGALVEVVARHAARDAPGVAYVAGGEGTIKRVREILTARGLERKAVKWEKFW